MSGDCGVELGILKGTVAVMTDRLDGIDDRLRNVEATGTIVSTKLDSVEGTQKQIIELLEVGRKIHDANKSSIDRMENRLTLHMLEEEEKIAQLLGAMSEKYENHKDGCNEKWERVECVMPHLSPVAEIVKIIKGTMYKAIAWAGMILLLWVVVASLGFNASIQQILQAVAK